MSWHGVGRLTPVAAVLAAGCATVQVPRELIEAPVPDLSVGQVQAEPTRHLGQRVRWGGDILAVRNHAVVTEIEILARPLNDSGVPSAADTVGLGRFVAEIAGFVDPTAFPKDHRITVAGEVVRVETRRVGDYPYPYPVVAVRHHRTFAPPVPDPYWHRYPLYAPPPWGVWGYRGPWGPWYRPWPYYW
jgi:outer membrane lipoprotein